MAFDLEEQEKIDQLKAWWDKFGTVLTVLVVIVMLGILGWNGWGWYQKNQTAQAVAYFETVQKARFQHSDDAKARLVQAVQTLQNDYASNFYTGRATLLAAASLAEYKDYDPAIKNLDWLLKNQKDFPELMGAAHLQLASVYADQGHFDQALQQVAHPDKGYEALYSDRQGDIFYAQGKKDQAIKAWEQAKKQPNISTEFINAMTLKLKVLGGINDIQ